MSQQLLKEVARPPVIVGIDANGQTFRFYSGGVFTGENCGTNLNHAVTAIGYNEDANGKYWLIRNSWGQHWFNYLCYTKTISMEVILTFPFFVS